MRHLRSLRFSPGLRAMVAMALTALAAPGIGAQPASGVQPFSGRYEGRQHLAFLTATAVALIELRRSSRFFLYTMHTTVSAAFIERRFLECSVMRIQDGRPQPVEYVHRDKSNPEHDVHTRFDWAASAATTMFGDAREPRIVALDSPAWDPMSYQVALIALAPQHRPGDRGQFRVIERGALKEHDATFVGAAAAADGQASQYEVVSRKTKGLIALRLLPGEAWRPARVTVDEVTIELTRTPVAAPVPLPEEGVPSCAGVRAP